MVEQIYSPRTRQTPGSSMPLDKQGKPFTPALSSNFRNAKSPLTPRLAGSAPNSPASAAKRDALTRNRSPAREDATGPLAGNVTPRTAARKSRIGTESPATPASAKAAATTRPRAVSGAGSKQSGLGITSNERVAPHVSNLRPSTTSPTPVYTVHRRISGAKSAVAAQDEGDAKFFHAADARSYASERPAQPSDANGFFFVGSPENTRTQSPKISPHLEPQQSIDEKFFHASDIRPQSGPKPPVRPHMPVRNGPPTAPARLPQIETTRTATETVPFSSKSYPPVAQPISPRRDAGRKVLSPADPARQNADRRGSISSNVSNVKSNLSNGHRKSMSTNSINVSPPRKQVSPRLVPLPNLDQRLANPLTTSTSSLDRSVLALPDQVFAQDGRSGSQPSIASPILDPTTLTPASQTPIEQTQTSPSKPAHDATNARRERKVLDLEISNSSLLAINKTLERELRKQSVELRRFRRLSRSGRLSIAPTNRSISSSTLDTVAEGSDNDLEMSSADEESETDTLDDEDILSNDSSSISSPTSRARQRARDEKRLMLDLSKHQQMLLDSQRLTQSIRRCLTCTEELIRDGNKALEYKVGIGDIQLGGRVLNREDEPHDIEDKPERKGLLSPSVTLSQLEEAALWLTDASAVAGVTQTPLEEAEREIDGFLGHGGSD
jgi:hypothetical protein